MQPHSQIMIENGMFYNLAMNFSLFIKQATRHIVKRNNLYIVLDSGYFILVILW